MLMDLDCVFSDTVARLEWSTEDMPMRIATPNGNCHPVQKHLLPRPIAFSRSHRQLRSTAIIKIRLFQTLAIEVTG